MRAVSFYIFPSNTVSVSPFILHLTAVAHALVPHVNVYPAPLSQPPIFMFFLSTISINYMFAFFVFYCIMYINTKEGIIYEIY